MFDVQKDLSGSHFWPHELSFGHCFEGWVFTWGDMIPRPTLLISLSPPATAVHPGALAAEPPEDGRDGGGGVWFG